ncbi:MAG: hypothetical protein IT201_14570 [Thermoleophilia bacterium]|nr:hypothetical protein [Thermoleophilia bacterium]
MARLIHGRVSVSAEAAAIIAEDGYSIHELLESHVKTHQTCGTCRVGEQTIVTLCGGADGREDLVIASSPDLSKTVIDVFREIVPN